jgi:hypothetical protein
MKEKERQNSNTDKNRIELEMPILFIIERKARPEIILINTWAFTNVISDGPKILKKRAGITQNIYPSGIAKSRKGISPLLILYAPSQDKKILIL